MNKCWYCGKELKNENNKEHIGICDKCYYDQFGFADKCVMDFIKHQAEKDQKITELKAKLAECEKESNDYVMSAIERYADLTNRITQAKTDFAITQLEKVKELIDKRNNGTRNGNHSEQYKDGYSGCCCDITDQIDQQIKELKGE